MIIKRFNIHVVMHVENLQRFVVKTFFYTDLRKIKKTIHKRKSTIARYRTEHG